MGKSVIIIQLFLYFVIFLMISCKAGNHQSEQPAEAECNWMSHRFTIAGKTVRFLLPLEYTDKGIDRARALPQYRDNIAIFQQSEFIFISTKNNHNFFALFVNPDSLEFDRKKISVNSILDSVVAEMKILNRQVGRDILFTEKKQDKNKQPYYLLTASSRYSKRITIDDPISKLNRSDSIRTQLTYLTYIGMTGYSFGLESVESMSDFSYDEKRKILESITIE